MNDDTNKIRGPLGMTWEEKKKRWYDLMKEDSMSAKDVLIPPNSPQPSLSQEIEEKLRMDAYYYSFNETGIRPIDEILSSVACAGKAYHNTDCWSECGKGETSPAEKIQAAANAASIHIKTLEAQNRSLEERLMIAKVSLAEQGEELLEMKDQRDVFKVLAEEATMMVKELQDRLKLYEIKS